MRLKWLNVFGENPPQKISASVFLLETFQQSDDLSDYFVNLKHFPTFSKALEKDQKF